jgi:hypothetical protein
MTFALANYLRTVYGAGPPVDFETYADYIPDADVMSDHPAGLDAYAFAERLDVPFVVRSHAPFSNDRFSGRVMLVLRDPHDVLVSQYHLVTKHLSVCQCDFREFLAGNESLAALGLPSPVHALSRYLDSWVSPVLAGTVPVTTYESWRGAPEAGLANLLCGLDIPLEQGAVGIACAGSELESMRKAEDRRPLGSPRVVPERKALASRSDANARFVRKAEVGGWRAELAGPDAALVDRLLDSHLTRRTKRMYAELGLPYEVGRG